MRIDPLTAQRGHGSMLPQAVVMAAGVVALGLCTRASAEQPRHDQRIEDTAYTLPGGGFSLGLMTAEAGIFDEITIGTYLPAWLAFSVIDAPILSGFIKLRAPWEGPLALSVRVGVAYLDASSVASDVSSGRATRADVLAVPFELAVSYEVSDSVTQSLELSCVAMKVGASERNAATGGGSATTSNMSVSSLLEVRLSPMLAVTLVGRLLAFQSAARITAHLERGPTRLKANLGFRPYEESFLWSVVPGVALSWANVHLEFGLGYGAYWLPMIQSPLPGSSPIPEGNLYVRF
jgi:hypothetical protein